MKFVFVGGKNWYVNLVYSLKWVSKQAKSRKSKKNIYIPSSQTKGTIKTQKTKDKTIT